MKQLLLLLLSTSCLFTVAQRPPAPYGVLPSSAQLRWHELEIYGLVHWGLNTYTDKEWGYGDEDPALLQPTAFDARQIVAAAKAGGLKGLVVVAKHHDGFCLWPTQTTTHNIRKSPWKNGQGDILREYRNACDALGMQLGFYCSPWDRNAASYGSAAYVDMYKAQLKELYSQYGPLFMSWHDGANGGDGYYGGARTRRTIDRSAYYGWDSIWALTRKMQPGAVIFGDVGPDVRWVGNEKGFAGETSWATYTPLAPEKGKLPANGFIIESEAVTGTRDGRYWMPAECDVPLRPGWFYHSAEDDKVRSREMLIDLYFKSVGRGACLDLGLAPDRRGQLHANDVAVLAAFGKWQQQTFARNLLAGAWFSASNIRGRSHKKYGAGLLTDNDRYSYWATDDKVLQAELEAQMDSITTFNVIRLRENIKLGQRIRAVEIDSWENGAWRTIAWAGSIGANRLIRLPGRVSTNRIRLRITDAAASIALSDLGLFLEP
ncbi:MAG: alpha-L-fucosidase [Candidatus Pseudobacter hemicellulosilyticus]|uniref:alpha-L-fucosidase n=1 Tax=Candidatus Pseudobacter hemicellulosilyticus TaxID=3121375 RepID=A0AAJ6BF54_9BACT|nr:MAG: alpha-L-fucosidase [Pseudobacter sp.]